SLMDSTALVVSTSISLAIVPATFLLAIYPPFYMNCFANSIGSIRLSFSLADNTAISSSKSSSSTSDNDQCNCCIASFSNNRISISRLVNSITCSPGLVNPHLLDLRLPLQYLHHSFQ